MMNNQDAMKYVESEYEIIKLTPCEICGGEYQHNYHEIINMDDELYDILICSCERCGHQKTFEFHAPYLEENRKLKSKKRQRIYH